MIFQVIQNDPCKPIFISSLARLRVGEPYVPDAWKFTRLDRRSPKSFMVSFILNVEHFCRYDASPKSTLSRHVPQRLFVRFKRKALLLKYSTRHIFRIKMIDESVNCITGSVSCAGLVSALDGIRIFPQPLGNCCGSGRLWEYQTPLTVAAFE